jgi:hypothetical protein
VALMMCVAEGVSGRGLVGWWDVEGSVRQSGSQAVRQSGSQAGRQADHRSSTGYGLAVGNVNMSELSKACLIPSWKPRDAMR